MAKLYKVFTKAVVSVAAQAATPATKKTKTEVAKPAKPARDSFTGKVIRWASAEGAAKKERRELMEAHGLKMADVEILPVDVPTSKAGIIEWLNANHSVE